MEIKYPNGKKVSQIKETAPKVRNLKKSNLGDAFEDMVNCSNDYYLNKQIAAIYKKPTPVQIVHVSYPSRNKAKITEAYYRMPSTTDYNGIYKGKYIDFEAKTCKENNFSFGRIYDHQIAHLETIMNMGGISFLLIEFSSKKEVYILPTKYLISAYQESKQGGRKSIPYSYFVQYGHQVPHKLNPPIDYLPVVDEIFFK